MKRVACPKLWQVEALRDHKLTGQLELEARSHLASCAICRVECESLAAMQAQLKAHAPIDELALRRLRGTVLSRANEQLQGRASAPAFAGMRLAVAVCLMLVAGAVAWQWRKPAAQALVQLQASAGAIWTRSSQPGTEYVDLADGLLTLWVNRHPADPRLIVRVPDGEVEDTGTRFRVWVSGGKTREIAVETGSVVYRRRDGSSVVLRAGEVWHSIESAGAPPAATPSTADAPASSAAAPVVPAPASRATSVGAKHALAASSSASSAVAGATDEDLAYLHIVALLHEARDDEARLAARDYLRRYPAGFRRVEVSKLLEASTTLP